VWAGAIDRSSKRRTDIRKATSRRTASPVRSDLICDKDNAALELEGLTAFVQLTDKPPQSYRYW
jgi:hypothetical protein